MAWYAVRSSLVARPSSNGPKTTNQAQFRRRALGPRLHTSRRKGEMESPSCAHGSRSRESAAEWIAPDHLSTPPIGSEKRDPSVRMQDGRQARCGAQQHDGPRLHLGALVFAPHQLGR